MKRSELYIPAPELVQLADINFDPFNPRTMPAPMMRSLKASLRKNGLVLNLVVRREGMILVGGHQRVSALRELCKEEGWPEPKAAWATVMNISEADARQLNVSLNNIEGEFDEFKLAKMFDGVLPSMTEDDVLATGFGRDNLEELMNLLTPTDSMAEQLEEEAAGLSQFARSVTLTIEFDSVQDRDAVKVALKEAAASEGRGAGRIILDALAARPAQIKAKKKGKSAAS